MSYYSARLHVICIVDDEPNKSLQEYTCDYPFVVFTAGNDDAAFRRALELGKEHETEYLNSDGNKVRWALKSVEHIWNLGDAIDGVEVGSIMGVYRPDAPIKFDVEFRPELETPIFSDESLSCRETDTHRKGHAG